MQIIETPIAGLLLIEPRVFRDGRGFFLETYNKKAFAEAGLPTEWAQDNHSLSHHHVLRGLHFQRGVGQAKLVRCIRGRVWDVAVDLRPGSSTFGAWHGVEISARNQMMYLIPAGFAHGFVALSDMAEVAYKCSTPYDASLEDQIRWDDPDLAIAWPVADPHLSDRDRASQSFRQYQSSIE